MTDQQKNIVDLLKKDPLINTKSLSEALGVKEAVINGLLKGLESDGLIKVTTTIKNESETTKRVPTADASRLIDNGGKAETASIKILYSYEGIKDDKNRPFCAKMLDLDRFFSRVEIESISARLGYSVWDRRGGWYRPKGAKEARPFCRHYWVTNTVTNKS